MAERRTVRDVRAEPRLLVVPVMAALLGCATQVPLARTCAEWSRLNLDDQLTTAAALIADRMDTVRDRQQLPETATDAEIVSAANGTIDKECQGHGPGAMLRERILAVYPRPDGS